MKYNIFNNLMEFNKYNQKLKDDFDNYQNMYEKEFEKFNQSFKNKEK